MSSEFKSSRPWRVVGVFFLDSATAIFGPVIVETSIWKLFPFHSASGVVLREWCLSVTLAAGMGLLMYRTWQSTTAKWTWILPTLWFSFGTLTFFWLHPSNVFFSGNTFWDNFSGSGCSVRRGTCRDFFAFTVPFIRAVAYSAGAWLASQFTVSRMASRFDGPPVQPGRTTSNV